MKRPIRAYTLGVAGGILFVLSVAPTLHAQAVEGGPVPATAQGEGPYDHGAAPSIRAVRITESITIDGRLDEPVWMTAPTATQFTQVVPDEGASITQPTEVRFLYDDTYLYVGGWMWDDGEVLARLARRDVGVTDIDLFAVHFDGYHDHRTAYRFAASPSGWFRDEFVVGGRGPGSQGLGYSDLSWDPIWENEATITDEGWFVEIAIPFSQLRYGSDDEQTWGLQIERKIRRWGEDTVWAFVPRSQPQGVARYGHLEGLQGIPQGKRLEILPYTTFRAEYRDVPRAPATSFDNPFRSGSDYFGNVGADLKYRLGTTFTLDATVNPDFGQVEADPAVINLSAFETRVSEMRPFFVEGSDIFRFGDGGGGAELLYSRRIGRTPQGSVPDESEYADIPSTTTILGAAKITGRTASGWSIGVLEAVSDRAVVPWVDAGGARERTEIEPRTNYLVARMRRDLNEGTRAFGGIVTAVNRDLRTAELEEELHASGYAVGVDGRVEWNDRAWSLSGKVAGSRVSGTADVIAGTQKSSARYFRRPDADHLEYDSVATSLGGYQGTIDFSKQTGTWRGGASISATSPGFEVNDLGFQSAADRVAFSGDFGWQLPTTTRRFRTLSVTASGGLTSTFGNEVIAKEAGLSVNGQLYSQHGFNARISRTFDSWDDRLTRGGPLTLSPGGWSGNVGVNTSQRNPVSSRLSFNYSEDDGGGWRKAASSTVTIRFKDIYEIVLGMSLSRSHSAAQYVTTKVDAAATETYGNRYVFAAIDQTTFDVSSRVNITFSPDLTFEFYTQPFVSSGDFLALKELAAPRTFGFREYGRDIGAVTRNDEGEYVIDPAGNGSGTFTVSDRDFNFSSLIGNAVLRWQWRPGSTLFFVWQHGRSERLTSSAGDAEGTYGDFALGRDSRRIFRIKPENTFMVKLTYWLNP